MKKFLAIEYLSTQDGWPNRGANIRGLEELPEIFTPRKDEELAVEIDQHGDVFVTFRVEGTMQEFCLYGIPEISGRLFPAGERGGIPAGRPGE
jgi:hypothetical protein